MAPKQDLALFAGLVVLGFCASQLVHKQLLAVWKNGQTASAKPQEGVPTQITEDALKLETLDALSKNVNDDIRDAAIKIIRERACKSHACHLLLRDLGSKSCERRDRALTTITYLQKSIPHCFDAYKYTAVQSIIDCLSHQLPLSRRYETARQDGKTAHRTQAECLALELLETFMTQYGVPLAVECNIFSLWLAQYPFGGDPYSHHINAEELRLAAKQKTIERIALGRAGCPAMGAIIKTIMHSDEGRAKMVEYELIGLLGAAFHDTNHDGGKDEYAEIWYEVHGVNTAPDIGLGPMMRRNPRAHDESFEEQTLRRRRREAMVLGEMGRPIEREDIIQRVVT